MTAAIVTGWTRKMEEQYQGCKHPTLRQPTPAMMEDGDWSFVCNDCLAAVRVAYCEMRRLHGKPTAYGQVLPFDPQPVASSNKLAFFRSRPGHDFDTYYCGCRGWD